MSDVRSRWEAKLEKPETIVSLADKPRSTLVVNAVPTMSTRQRAENAASPAEKEVIVRNESTQSRGLTAAANYNQSLRSRLEREEFVRRHQANPEPESRQEISERLSADLDLNIRIHKAELAREDAERQELIRSGKLRIL